VARGNGIHDASHLRTIKLFGVLDPATRRALMSLAVELLEATGGDVDEASKIILRLAAADRSHQQRQQGRTTL
jgi:hypothetical protein